MGEHITSNGVKFYLDDEDDHLVGEFKWNANPTGHIRRRDAKTDKTIFLHVLVFEPLPGTMVDHIDRDPTNNRYDNLRGVTPTQNRLNTGYKGVIKTPRGWWARVGAKGVRHDLGYHLTEEAAIKAVQDFKKTLF